MLVLDARAERPRLVGELGGEQHAKPGDWLVKNHFDGETYTVDGESFEETYTHVSPGVYIKTAPVWATQVAAPSEVATKEGQSHLEPGDYIVSNHEDGTDAYAIEHDSFHQMYELDA